MTKTEMFNEIKAVPAVASNPEMVAFIDHELELISKRKSGERKPTSKQIANAAIKEAIVNFLSEQDSPVKVADIMANVDGLTSVPHLSALLSQLRADNKVVREYDKKTPIYSLAVEG